MITIQEFIKRFLRDGKYMCEKMTKKDIMLCKPTLNHLTV